MAKGKSPGLDGLLSEFYSALCPVIGDGLFWMCQEAMNASHSWYQVNASLIKLIPNEM